VLFRSRTFEAVTKTMVPFEIQDRRTGDIVSMYANTSLAERELGWKAKYTLEQMCKWKQQIGIELYLHCSFIGKFLCTNDTTVCNRTLKLYQLCTLHEH
jgi:hypothetical protein